MAYQQERCQRKRREATGGGRYRVVECGLPIPRGAVRCVYHGGKKAVEVTEGGRYECEPDAPWSAMEGPPCREWVCRC